MSEEYNASKIAKLGGEYRVYYSKRMRTVEHGQHAGEQIEDRVTNVIIRMPSINGGDFEYGKGEAFCHPKDPFRKKTGRAIALGRAVSSMSRGISYKQEEFDEMLFQRKEEKKKDV